jgi:hypothetical protein
MDKPPLSQHVRDRRRAETSKTLDKSPVSAVNLTFPGVTPQLERRFHHLIEAVGAGCVSPGL